MPAPKAIDSAALRESARKTGRLVARRFFSGNGSRRQMSITEDALAAVVAVAIEVYAERRDRCEANDGPRPEAERHRPTPAADVLVLLGHGRVR